MSLFLPFLLYAAVVVFALGMAWRLSTWKRAPVPLKIVLTPGPATGGGVVRRLAGELFLFRSLFGADRGLWVAAWLFHLSLALLAVGHLGGLVTPGLAKACLGLTEEQFHSLAQVAGGTFGVMALIPLLYLLSRRFSHERTRYISTFSDYFALVLLGLVLATGNHMRFLGGLESAQAREFVSGWFNLQPVAPPTVPAFKLHVVLVCALLVYIPFSKLVHLGGLAFNPTLNQKNNPREERFA